MTDAILAILLYFVGGGVNKLTFPLVMGWPLDRGVIKYITFRWGGGFNITRTSEWVITLWRSCELFLCSMSEISQQNTMNMIYTDDHHKIVLVFMTYYYWLDIDFIMVCVYNLTSLLVKQQYHNLAY